MDGRTSLRRLLFAGSLLFLVAAAASLLAREGSLAPGAAARWARGAVRPEGTLFQVPAGSPEELIRKYGCLSCHTLDGAGAHVGPVLNGVRERLTREEIRTWLSGPWRIKPGTKMPDFGFTETELRVLADYLMTK